MSTEKTDVSVKLESIPLGLQQALESGECVLFIGSGIGQYVIGPDKKPGPDGYTLAKELANHYEIDVSGEYDLSKIAEIIELRKGRTELEVFLKQKLANLEPDHTLRWLFSLRWKAIFTTNYDRVIERAYELNPNPSQQAKSISITSDLVPLDARLDVPIYHLHGMLFDRSDPKVIITQTDYAKFKESRRMLFELLKKEFSTSNILYVGYSNKDPNWHTVRAEIESEFYPAKIPTSYRIAPTSDSLDIEILKAKGIETISASLSDFSRVASATLKNLEQSIDKLKKLQANIPSRLAAAYEKTPAAILRLLSSWTFVNQAPFGEAPNAAAFLKGDRANWALIAQSQHFERDLEEELYEEILDYITAGTKYPKSVVVIGAAGYGITTELLSLAVRAVKDQTGPVFTHKPGTVLLEGDIEFATSIFSDQRPVFVIDNASDFVSAISSVTSHLRDLERPAFFLLGDRKNEWRQAQGRFHPREFEIESLSEPEIIRLLDRLGQHGALGALEPLDRDIQVATIKTKHGKDLLVTMRESTEDNQFDAILEDEFRGINNELAQKLYLLVCGFYQHGAYVRDTLLADLLDCPLTDLHSRTSIATEGVVVYDCIDESTGRYAARARHRTIATVVWERCGELSEKERLLQASISALNLNYMTDKEAFEQFIRSDRMVDSIKTLEGKIRFFDTACQKDPQSPYVRQHFARMLSRERKLELALSQIDEALKLDPAVRVLHHTRGIVLQQLAVSTPSIDLARKRLVQSEESFRRCLAIYDRDEYSYQGLAKLYLEWAKRVDDPEAAEYISRSEGIISEGLKKVKIRDGLRIVSAEVEDYLGNKPAHIEALEKAVAEAPGSIIARYLLGRKYRKSGQHERAVEVLRPVIKDYPEEFRSCIEFALASRDLGESYSYCIGILNIGTLYGLSDPRFIATLGGMYFMNREFSHAEKIFLESVRRELSSSESYVVHFRPREPNDTTRALRIQGRIVDVRAGYAFIESTEYPKFLCPGSKYGGLIMKRGLNVTFEICFSAKGPLADKPQPNLPGG
jgi:tetratricopeptide (TPR) repeat protein